MVIFPESLDPPTDFGKNFKYPPGFSTCVHLRLSMITLSGGQYLKFTFQPEPLALLSGVVGAIGHLAVRGAASPARDREVESAFRERATSVLKTSLAEESICWNKFATLFLVRNRIVRRVSSIVLGKLFYYFYQRLNITFYCFPYCEAKCVYVEFINYFIVSLLIGTKSKYAVEPA